MEGGGFVLRSSFAGLRIEDDEPSTSGTQKPKKSTVSNTKKTEGQKKKSKSQVKKKTAIDETASAEQWEMWKLKDEQFVDGNFASELEQAILLSKLDFEEKEELYEQRKKEAERERIAEASVSSKNKKKKKQNVMSLDEFNGMVNRVEGNTPLNSEKPTTQQNKDPSFFERINQETKSEFIKDKINNRIKTKQEKVNEELNKVKFIDILEQNKKEILTLKQEVDKIKAELFTVKSRNKKLCSILGHGEMREKSEILIELNRLRAMQMELTAEIATLHTDLEKERSKTADMRPKQKKRAVTGAVKKK